MMVTNVRMVPIKSAATGTKNWVLRPRVVKLDQWGNFFMAISDSPIVCAPQKLAERK